METRLIQSERFSRMRIAAVLAVITLIAVSVSQGTGSWKDAEISAVNEVRTITVGRTVAEDSHLNWQSALDEAPASGEEGKTISDLEGLSNIGKNVMGALVGSYVAMKDAGMYTPAQGEAIAEAISSDLRADISFRLYSESDLAIVPDTSIERILSYRSDVRIALEPLLENGAYELEVFARYLDTNDESHLADLARMAQNYSAAIENSVGVEVPKDAVSYHVGMLNSLSEFEAILEKLASYADDPFAAAALLRAFGSAETNVLMSFNALAGYYREHPRL